MIKIFDLGSDWYAAETLEEAIECYIGDMTFASSYTREEVLDELVQDPHEETDLGGLLVQDDGGEVDTFANVLGRMVAGGVEFPAFFASMEY